MNKTVAVVGTIMLSLIVLTMVFFLRNSSEPCADGYTDYRGTCVQLEAASFLMCLRQTGLEITVVEEELDEGKSNFSFIDLVFDVSGRRVSGGTFNRVVGEEISLRTIDACEHLLPNKLDGVVQNSDSVDDPYFSEESRAIDVKNEIVNVYADFILSEGRISGDDNRILEADVNQRARVMSERMRRVDDSYLSIPYQVYKYHYLGLVYYMMGYTEASNNPTVALGYLSRSIESYRMVFSLLEMGEDGFSSSNDTRSREVDMAFQWALEDQLIDRNRGYKALALIKSAKIKSGLNEEFLNFLSRADSQIDRISAMVRQTYRIENLRLVEWMRASQ